MSKEAKKYFTLRRQEEIHCLERRMQVERHQAELEELKHAKLVKKCNLEAPPARNRAVAAPAAPVVTLALQTAPSPTIPDSTAASTDEIPQELPVFAGIFAPLKPMSMPVLAMTMVFLLPFEPLSMQFLVVMIVAVVVDVYFFLAGLGSL